MATRFAGSRSVDERRRRRLAQEAEIPDPPRRASKDRKDSPAADDQPHPALFLADESPVESIIRPQCWKHVAFLFIVALVGAVTIYLGVIVDRTALAAATVPTGPLQVFSLRGGLVQRYVSMVMLLATGQLSFVVFWYRAHSRRDFQGRYRIWLHTAILCLILSGMCATDLHHVLARLVVDRFELKFWNAHSICWMMPVAAAVVAALCSLHRETRRCRSSLAMLWLAAGTSLMAAGLILAGGFVLPGESLLVVQIAGGLLAQFGLFAAVLLHARYVIHVNSEPPRKSDRRLHIPRLRIPSLTGLTKWLPMRSAAEVDPDEPRKPTWSERRQSAKAARQETKAKKRAAAEQKSKMKQEAADQKAAAKKKAATKEKAATKVNAKPAPSKRRLKNGSNIRIDQKEAAPAPARSATSADNDADDTAKLSKRERRRRKRQQQTAD